MVRIAVLYRLDTGEPDGIISPSCAEDVVRQHYNADTHALLEIDAGHPVAHEQHAWNVIDGALVRKNSVEIARANTQRRYTQQQAIGPHIEEILLNEINELRRALNLPEKTLLEMPRTPSKERDNR
jgi:hypothetical protein